MDRYVDYLPLDEVQPADRNPKVHDAAGIARSITHHGLAELPLLDERTGRLVAGHGRHQQLTALRDVGDTAPDGVHVDNDGTWRIPVIRGWASRTDDDAAAYGVASNRLVELGGWDDRELVEVLSSLGDADLLALTGYTAGDVDELLRATDTLGDAATAFLGEVIDGNPPPARTPPPAGTDHPYNGDDTEPAVPPGTDSGLGWVSVSWLVTLDDRATIRAALANAQRRWDLDTTAASLAALCRHYLESEPA